MLKKINKPVLILVAIGIAVILMMFFVSIFTKETDRIATIIEYPHETTENLEDEKAPVVETQPDIETDTQTESTETSDNRNQETGASNNKTQHYSKIGNPGIFYEFNYLVHRLLIGSFIVSVLLSLYYICWGGIDWITSGGKKEKISAARDKIIAAVIGLIIVSSSYALLNLVLQFLGVTSLFSLLE